MKRIICLVILLSAVLHFQVSEAGTPCGESECEANHLCLDRGDGESCWRICRWDWQCESGCCTQIIQPYTAWICGTDEDCGSTTASDGDGSAGIPCGDSYCVSGEYCITVTTGGSSGSGGDEDGGEANIRVECAKACVNDSDCPSGCCADTLAGRACWPSGVECPEETPIGGSGVSCGSQAPFTNSLAWIILVLFAFFLRPRGSQN